MNLDECIKKRRSIRKFLDKEVSDEDIKKIIEAANYAPSSFSGSPWKFIVTKDKSFIKRLLGDRIQLNEPDYDINSREYAEKSEMKKYTDVQIPPAMIIVCGERERCPYSGSLISSISIAVENILLKATDLGLGSCWLYVYDPDTPKTEKDVREILGFSDDILVLCFIILGYPDLKFKLNPKKMRKIDEIIEWR